MQSLCAGTLSHNVGASFDERIGAPVSLSAPILLRRGHVAPATFGATDGLPLQSYLRALPLGVPPIPSDPLGASSSVGSLSDLGVSHEAWLHWKLVPLPEFDVAKYVA